MPLDIFSELNHAVLDLQASQLQTYERPLKKIAQLLDHEELASFNRELTSNVDLDAFLATSEATGGSMVGSSTLEWPDNSNQCLGLTILLLKKLAENPGYAASFAHEYFYSGNKIIAGIHSLTGQLIIPFVRDYRNYVRSKGDVRLVRPTSSKKIFIVHGHDEGSRESVARFLEKIGFEPIILHEQANRGRTVIEKVEAHGDVGFAVVLLTPDDEGCVRGGSLEPRARQNVLLELGYFIGRLGRDHVCALKRGELEIPSDFAGVVWELMDSSGGWKQALARELKAAGHYIDWNLVMQ
jgi:hypothetical protein